MAKALSPARRAQAKNIAEAFLDEKLTGKGPHTIRDASKITGVSRAFFHKLVIEVRSERVAVTATPLRTMFGDAPLRPGLGLKMIDPEWRRKMGAPA